MTTFDSRDWVDRMFLTPEKTPLEVLVKDTSEETNFFNVSLPRDSIPFLVDFCAEANGNHELKGEHIIILGGARATRSSLGRLYIPIKQLPKFVEYVTQLNNFLQENAGRLVEEARSSG